MNAHHSEEVPPPGEIFNMTFTSLSVFTTIGQDTWTLIVNIDQIMVSDLLYGEYNASCNRDS